MRTKLVCLAICLVATAAFAQKPSEKLKELKPFAGTYVCKGITFASEMAPEHATRATVTGVWELGGYWLNVEYKETKTKANPMPFRGKITMGYDEGAKKLVAGFVDNYGGFGTQSSEGWEGDTFTLLGTMHMGGMTVEAKDTFVKKGAKLTHTGEIKPPGGEWKKLDEETCRK